MKEGDPQELKDLVSIVRKRVSDKLVELKWDVRKLAEEAGMSYEVACVVMRGNHAPNTRTLIKLLNAVGLRLEVVE